MHRFDIWRSTHSRAFIWRHTLTMSHLPMRNIRQQLRLLPLILSKIYYGVKLDSKFQFSKKLKNEWDITSKGIFLYILWCIFLLQSVLIGHLLIVFHSKLFRRKFIVMIRYRKSFLHQHLHQHQFLKGIGEGIMGRGQNNMRKRRKCVAKRKSGKFIPKGHTQDCINFPNVLYMKSLANSVVLN